jgi:hypothetical protein
MSLSSGCVIITSRRELHENVAAIACRAHDAQAQNIVGCDKMRGCDFSGMDGRAAQLFRREFAQCVGSFRGLGYAAARAVDGGVDRNRVRRTVSESKNFLSR